MLKEYEVIVGADGNEVASGGTQGEVELKAEQGIFRCDSCRNYNGPLSCEKGVFIVFEGANLNHCSFYVPGKKCRHCGKVT